MTGTEIMTHLTELFDRAADDPDALGGRDADELVGAYLNGLDWFVNFNGQGLDRAFDRYINALFELGFEGPNIDIAYENQGLENPDDAYYVCDASASPIRPATAEDIEAARHADAHTGLFTDPVTGKDVTLDADIDPATGAYVI
jgi:hypothetical protein